MVCRRSSVAARPGGAWLAAGRRRASPPPRELTGEIVVGTPTRSSSVLPLLLFLSGFSALVYQMVWLREFRLVFGGATPAAAAVLAVYMGGLGLGGIWLGRRSERSPALLRLYGMLEGAIGVTAFLTPALLVAVRGLYIRTGGVVAMGPAAATLVQLLLSVGVLLAPCTLMGGTLPVAVRWAETDADVRRGAAGLLYGLNTLGALAGTVASTLWLLERLGARGTLWAASALNLGIAAVALRLAAREAAGGAAVAPPAAAAPLAARPGADAGVDAVRQAATHPRADAGVAAEPHAAGELPAAGAYGVAFVTGFVFFLVEIVWFRMLAPLLGSSTYSLGLILALVLAGIGLGGAAYRAAAARNCGRAGPFALGVTLALQAFWLMLPLALGDRFAVFAFAAGRWFAPDFAGRLAAWTLVAGAAVLLPSLVAGFQFPLLLGLLGRGRAGVGRQLGHAYAANTAGALAGSLLGGFVLVPGLGAPGCWRLAGGLLLGLALGALWLDRRQAARPRRVGAGVALAGIAWMIVGTRGPTAFWRHTPIGYGLVERLPDSPAALEDLRRDRRRRTHRQFDGRETSVGLVAGGSYSLFLNGKSDGEALGDAPTQVMLGLVGAALHPQPRAACVVGLGTGSSAGWLADLPGMERVDVVEIEPGIGALVRAAFAPVNRDVLAKPNVRLVLADAREMLLVRGPAYDVIASEPSNPYRAGIASLYTREFYRAVAGRLNPGGIFCQWLQGYRVDPAAIALICATLDAVFPHVEIWVTKPGDLLFVCHQEPPAYPLARLRQRLAEPVFAEALRRAWLTDSVEGFLARHYAGPEMVRRLAAGAGGVNTDDRNLLEYRLARAFHLPGQEFTTAGLLQEAMALGVDVPAHLRGQMDGEQLRRERLLIAASRVPAEGAGAGELSARSEVEAGPGESDQLAVAAYARRDYAAVLRAWPVPPATLKGRLLWLEAAGQAGAAADGGELLARMEADWPVEAHLTRARLALRGEDPAAARQHLTQALAAMRSSPWLRERPTVDAMELACTLGESDAAAAAAFFALLDRPLPVAAYEDRRLFARLLLARRLPPADQVAAVAAYEPHPPWNRAFLEYRQAAYAAAGDPRAAAARRDLERFVD